MLCLSILFSHFTHETVVISLPLARVPALEVRGRGKGCAWERRGRAAVRDPGGELPEAQQARAGRQVTAPCAGYIKQSQMF